ncbi:MAG: excinuclease ABC subunit UvrA [Bacteroidales bacterium]
MNEKNKTGKQEYISIEGARVNNLKNISLKIPRNKLVVVSGLSGSGKSSLAFETLFAEGQRRFAESLSSFARQFLGRMTKPAVDKIEGIPPAIAIEQKVNTRNPRSTVGTNTEIYDYLRLMFAKIGRTYSPISGTEVKRESVQDVIAYVKGIAADAYKSEKQEKREEKADKKETGKSAGTTNEKEKNTQVAYVLAPFGWRENSDKVEKLLSIKDQGYGRLFANGEVIRLDAILKDVPTYSNTEVLILIDRFILPMDSSGFSDDEITQMQDSIQSAFSQGKGHLKIAVTGETISYRDFSTIFEADGICFEEPTGLMFSYNNPIGACPVCGGYGSMVGIDEGLVIPNSSLSVYEGAVACWRGEIMGSYLKELIYNAGKFDFPIHRPYAELTKEQKKVLWDGNSCFTGINGFFEMVESMKYKIQYKYMLARYSGKTICRECEGSRLRKETNYVKIGGRTITNLMDMSITNLALFFKELTLEEYESKIAGRAIKEVCDRLSYIEEVGLGYLTLNRAANTLSGGESQRINLVSSLGSSLVGSLYILDEPSIGLHPRDTERLITVIKRLRDLGNTVLIVEHDAEIIRSADELIDIGPYAGVHGGEVVFQGDVQEGISRCLENKSSGQKSSPKSSCGSLTIDYLSGKKKIEIASKKRTWNHSIEVVGAMEHNLKNITAQFPLGVITAVTGVSGSGKSSLVGDILYPALGKHFQQFGNKPGAFKELRGDLSRITSVEFVDQNPIGKSSRSNPVTYLKIYDDIRKLFSEQPYAKLNGFGHSHFSFNIDGGRCPQCLGDGFITIPMQFMADVQMVCEECGGKRFRPTVLEVKYHDKNINDILTMSVEEAIAFFGSQKESTAKRVAQKLKVLDDVGLSYVQLGQSSSSLSGGESQRIKLAQFLSKDTGKGGKGAESILFIFDEPTTGLHFHDIQKLLRAFNALVEKGHSIIVVEHNTDVIRSADWVIDMGPDGGENGGHICFAGTPEDLAKVKGNYTGEALAAEYLR